MPDSDIPEPTKRICIIGAGPTGLAALQAVLESPQYSSGLWEPTLFEQKANVGGVWCRTMSSTCKGVTTEMAIPTGCVHQQYMTR